MTSSFKIAIIKPNKFQLAESDLCFARLNTDRLHSELEKYIQITEVDGQEDMINKIVEHLELTPEILAYTDPCFDTCDYSYKICYTMENRTENNLNGIATYLLGENIAICGTAIVIKTYINSDNTCASKSLSLDETIDVLASKFIHKGIVITPSGSVDETKYIYNPVDWISPSDITNIINYEVSILDKVLMIFIELNPRDNKINEKASVLHGTSAINGRVVLGLKQSSDNQHYQYIDLDKTTLDKLVQVFSNENQTRTMTSDEDVNDKVVDNQKYINNFYRIIHNRFLKLNNDAIPSVFNNIKDSQSLNSLTLAKKTADK
jgi:hypothetical protein